MATDAAELFGRLFVFILKILWEGFFEYIFFYTGKFALLAITFGKYPREKHLKIHEIRIALFGMLIWGIPFLYLVIFYK